MVYKRFTLVIIINIIIFTALIFLFFWASEQDYLSFTKFGFAGLATLEIGYILFLLNKTNYQIYRFLENFVINESFPKFKNEYKEKYFQNLEKELNRIAESYGKVKLEKESEHHLLLNTLEHLDSAIIAVNQDNKVHFSNSAFKNLLPNTINEISDIQKINSDLFTAIQSTKAEKPIIIKLPHEGSLTQFSVKTSQFVLNKNRITLYSFNDIGKELAQKEIQSWQSLIRILRHEIINSVTPIASLSSSMVEMYNTDNDETKKLLNISQKSFSAIEKRSKGMLDFIEKFKTISAFPEPKIENINIIDLFQHIAQLYKGEFKSRNILLNIKIEPKNLRIRADEKLIIQVLINLIKNSTEAFNNRPDKKITLSAHYNNETVVLSIEDNGIGIPIENTDTVFIPFYTTKKEGSGIGLSFARQVLFLHNGYINIQSKENEFTKIELLF